ncbi:helix-turn-helix domain-containing protein [Fundicoccus culcitae]|uniref:Helix-turn-helix transcriptional regulator n=1 Tax=Fundicoccus culcitae TaxID=2969821 RepID=A0ABY5P960_9LACT|nr:helix-turn-helix transcriptional regulator [Fundicoccus culcitae]UUX35209.1 helix-turn-helix transcriptional regulator [Fundicoccus culcitae]
MSTDSMRKTEELARIIKDRRLELALTVQKASNIASVGVQTWKKYEAGNPIRQDKIKGILKALEWTKFPDNLNSDESIQSLLNEYQSHDAWSKTVFEYHGLFAAISFCAGTDILSDYIDHDLEELSSLPKGTHIGQLQDSELSFFLPSDYLMEYDYNFLFSLRKSLNSLISQYTHGNSLVAHKPIDEILLYLTVSVSDEYIKEIRDNLSFEESEKFEYSDGWIFDVFDDMDVETYLFSNFDIGIPNDYQFNNWFKEIFYVSRQE